MYRKRLVCAVDAWMNKYPRRSNETFDVHKRNMEITLKPKNQKNPVPDDVWIYDGEILRSLNEQRLDLVWTVKDGVATPKHAKDDKHTWLFTATRIEPKEFRLDDVWEYNNGIVEPKILYSHSRRYSFDGIEFKESL